MSFLAELCSVLREHVVSCSALLSLARECGAINMSGGLGGGAQPPPSAKKNRTAKRYFLLSPAQKLPHLQNIEQDGKAVLLAKSCKDLLAQKLPKKNERGGVGGGAAPPFAKPLIR